MELDRQTDRKLHSAGFFGIWTNEDLRCLSWVFLGICLAFVLVFVGASWYLSEYSSLFLYQFLFLLCMNISLTGYPFFLEETFVSVHGN